MLSTAFNTLLYQPFYNGLIFLISLVPGGNVGVAVIVLTLAVKLVLFLLSFKSTKAQAALKEKMTALEPELVALKKAYEKNNSEKNIKILELYRKHHINPLAGLAGVFLMLAQIPVILALYFVFLRGGLPAISLDLLYNSIPVPEHVAMSFLWIGNISEKSIILALLTGLTQFAHAHLMFPSKPKTAPKEPSLGEDFARSMQVNMKYAFPVLIGFFAYSLSAAVAIYWITSNIFAIGQDWYVKRLLKRETRQ